MEGEQQITMLDDQALPLHDLLHRGSDRICNLILYSDLPWIDIEIQAGHLRDFCLEEAGDKLDLFEAVYMRRFERLWEQWRTGE
jgi:hypothetical protein